MNPSNLFRRIRGNASDKERRAMRAEYRGFAQAREMGNILRPTLRNWQMLRLKMEARRIRRLRVAV